MHDTAMENGKLFFDTYVRRLASPTIVEIGSQNVNGSLRDVCPDGVTYVGLDFVEAAGVDIVLTDPYVLPIESDSADVVVSSSCFEHSEMFWLVFAEVMRILKPNGLFYLNVPSNGSFHRYPVDCWRFYPDSGNAMVAWGKRCGYRPALLESYTARQDNDIWNDFVAVFVKDEAHTGEHPERILAGHHDFENGCMFGQPAIINRLDMPEDRRRRDLLSERVAQAEVHLAAQEERVKDLEAALAETHRQLDEALGLVRALAETRRQLDEALGLVRALESSTSWRVTAPLRAAKRILTGEPAPQPRADQPPSPR